MLGEKSKLLLWYMIVLFVIYLLSGCAATKPPIQQYRDVLFLNWTVDNEDGVMNYNILYSPNQQYWEVLKKVDKAGKNYYADTLSYLAGFYMIKVNLQNGSVLSTIKHQ